MASVGSLVIERDKCLKAYNSLALPARAEYFCEVSSVIEIRDALAFATSNKLSVIPLGAGSNIIFAANQNGLVMQLRLAGIAHKYPEDKRCNTVDVTLSAEPRRKQGQE